MLDLGIIGVILFFGIVGYHRGLIKTLMTLLSSVIALILSFIMYPMINALLRLTPIYTYTNKWVAHRIEGINFGTGVQTQGSAIIENITWMPSFISEELIKNNNQEVYKLLNVSSITDYISSYLTNIIISLLAVIITWLILKILLVFFLETANGIASHVPIVSNINKVGGGLIGIGKGLLAIWIICLVVPIIITYPIFEGINSYIIESYVGKWLYENNMILMAFNSIFNL